MENPTFGQGNNSLCFDKQESSALIGGRHRAVAYSGFRRGQHPDRGRGAKNPSPGQILEDLQILAETGRFRLIRLYDSQDNSRMVLQRIAAHQLPVKVMLGAWLDAELSNHEGCAWLTEPVTPEELAANRRTNQEEVRRTIKLAREFSEIVVGINIGNEALIDWNDHLVSVEAMVSYIEQVQSEVPQPVGSADNYLAWMRYASELSSVVDFAGVHTYPIWEYKTIEEALSYTIENMVAVRNALPGVPLSIMEAGWATVASEFAAQANEENQAIYFNQLMAWTKRMNITTFWFEAFDEDWKGDPNDPHGAEKHWGLFTLDREPKAVIR